MVEAYVDKELPPITISIGMTEMKDTDSLQRVDKAFYLFKMSSSLLVM